MAERKQITKRVRFDVFKRDRFCCQYCGATPPSAVLEVDHIIPVAEGGSNQIDNLVTSCFDCNRGKADKMLSDIPQTIEEKIAVISEKRDQIKAFERLLKSERKHEEKAINNIESIFQEFFPDKSFTSHFRESIRSFNNNLHQDQIEFAMRRACSLKSSAHDATKYFCGICWNLIKGSRHGSR